jgi:hypothetical protein
MDYSAALTLASAEGTKFVNDEAKAHCKFMRNTGLLVLVYDVGTREVIPGATVDVSGTPGTTDTNGIAHFKPIKSGKKKIRVTATPTGGKKYEDHTAEDFRVPARECPVKEIGLKQLPSLKVKVVYKQGGPTGSGAETVLDGVTVDVNTFGPTTNPKPTGVKEGAWAWSTQLKPGSYEITVTSLGAHATKYRPPVATTETVQRGDAKEVILYVTGPKLIVEVQEANTTPVKRINGIKIKVKKGTTALADKTTSGDLPVVWDPLEPDPAYEVTMALSADDRKKYKVESNKEKENKSIGPTDDAKVIFKLIPYLRVHLKLAFKDPEDAERVLPKDLKLKLKFDEASVADIEVKLDDQGRILGPDNKLGAEVERKAKGFYLDFAQTGTQYVKCEKRGVTPATQALAAEAAVDQEKTADYRAFRLPIGAWTQKNSDWTVDAAPAYDSTNRKFKDLDKPDTTVGEEASPVKLVLDPHWHYYRFVYYDMRYGDSDHGKKPITIPPIMLKGARKSVDGSPAAFDAICDWTIGADGKSLSQCLPWILSRTDDGSAVLDPLDKDTLLEFDRPAGSYVVAKAQDDHEIQKVDAAGTLTAKPALDLHRPEYYDLPEQWKNRNYYTRFTDGTGKFFDDLVDDPDGAWASLVGQASDKTKYQTFSLDDIVLTVVDSQDVKDKDSADADKALAADSRVAQLYLNPDNATDKYKMELWEVAAPGYYSTKGFARDKHGKYRNVIVEYHPHTRAAVFCSGFHDVYDKRTKNAGADFAKKHVVGARAAKLNDADVSFQENVVCTDKWEDYTAEGCGNFAFHLLQYGAVDFTNNVMYCALVTYWSCRMQAGAGVTGAEVDNHRDEGMKNSMQRWNVKNYEVRLTNRTTLKGKTFCLFENKLDDFGGKHICMVDIVKDVGAGGSWMGKDTSHLRVSAYDLEPGRFPGMIAADTDAVLYDCLADAHEIGHATGLHDEYVYDLDDYAGLVRYVQYYPGMPYVPDNRSLMLKNSGLRLHQYWGKVSWVNKNVTGIPAMTNADKDKLEIVFPSPDLHYTRPAGETLKHVYSPLHTEGAYAWSGGGCTTALHWYRLGDDEFSRNLKNGPYKGIAVVTPWISAKFTGQALNSSGAWVAGTAYALNDMVEQAGTKYACKALHNASPTFAPDQAANWVALADKGAWAIKTAYAVNDLVTDGGNSYKCTAAHTSPGRADPAGNWAGHVTDKGNWATNTNYANGDLVTDSGNKYLCKAPHKSGANLAAHQGNWSQVNPRGAWAAKTAYVKKDLVTDDGQMYYCLVDHTSANLAANAGNWQALASKGAWAAGKAYAVKQVYTVGVAQYACKSKHNASPTFAADQASKWTAITGKGAWMPNTLYSVDDVVGYGSCWYKCKTAHTSATRADDAAHWIDGLNVRGAWATPANYAALDVVTDGGSTYVCGTAHPAGANLAAHQANWVKVTDRGAWAADTAYVRADIVTDGGQTCFSKDAHTSANLKTHQANWTETHPAGSWTDKQKAQWLGKLDKDFRDMIAGGGGKFILSGAGELHKSYVALFPQWELPTGGAAASAGTHYELEIKRDNADGITAAGKAVSVGENCDTTKIMRHFLGLVINTDVIAKGDLAKLKDWAGTQAGGAWTVEDI